MSLRSVPPLAERDERQSMAALEEIPRGVLRGTGLAATLLALLGLSYNAASVVGVVFLSTESPSTPYFSVAYVLMSAVCTAMFALVLVAGIDLLRGRARHRWMLVFVCLTGVAYFFLIRFMWMLPNESLASSVAEATGLANGGIMFFYMTLFPFWAPILVLTAHLWQQKHVRGLLVRAPIQPQG